jgi:hypothetical protein
MSKEYNIDPFEIESEEEECDSCKKGLGKGQAGIIVLSFFMLGTSIYGTVMLVKDLISLFQ